MEARNSVSESNTIPSKKSADEKPDPERESHNSVDHIRKFLRPIKYALIDLFISLARVLFCWLPGGDLAKGQALLVFHFVGGCLLYTIYFLMPPHHPLRLFIFLLAIVVILQQIVFRGCVITKAEQTLTKNSETVMDPWIHLIGLEPTKDLRNACSIGIAGSMTLTLLMNTVIEQFQPYN